MADSFDNFVFSSSLVIFILSLVLIFVYEFVSTKDHKQNLEKITGTGKINKKFSKQYTRHQSDKIE